MKKRYERKWEDRDRMEMKVCESVKWECEMSVWKVNSEMCVMGVMGWVSDNDNEDDEDSVGWKKIERKRVDNVELSCCVWKLCVSVRERVCGSEM